MNINKKHRIQYKNNENHENLKIPIENLTNHEHHRIP